MYKILLSVRTPKGTFERQQLKMTNKRKHRSYDGGATWDNFPCVSAKYIYTHTQQTPTHAQTERKKREKRKRKKERKKKEGERELGSSIRAIEAIIEA